MNWWRKDEMEISTEKKRIRILSIQAFMRHLLNISDDSHQHHHRNDDAHWD